MRVDLDFRWNSAQTTNTVCLRTHFRTVPALNAYHTEAFSTVIGRSLLSPDYNILRAISAGFNIKAPLSAPDVEAGFQRTGSCQNTARKELSITRYELTACETKYGSHGESVPNGPRFSAHSLCHGPDTSDVKAVLFFE